MGNAQSDPPISFGSRNLLLSNKEKKLPSSAKGKSCSLFWALLYCAWFICNVTIDVIDYIIEPCQLSDGNSKAMCYSYSSFLFSNKGHYYEKPFNSSTWGTTPSDIILKAAICCFRLTGNVRHSSIPMTDPVWLTRVWRGLWWCHSFPRTPQETKYLRTEEEANVDNITRNKWWSQIVCFHTFRSSLIYLYRFMLRL